jgi:FtsP/CotA-like multicopper oxidase with cupredoxin domain
VKFLNKKIGIFIAVLFLIATLIGSINFSVSAQSSLPAPTLDPNTIPKFVDQLVIPPVYIPTSSDGNANSKQSVQHYNVDMVEFYEQILPTVNAQGTPTGFGQTKVWGYAGTAKDAITGQNLGYFKFSPSCTFQTMRGQPVEVTWTNKITTPSLFAVDPTIHWANPNNIPMDMGMGTTMPGTPTAPFPAFPPGFDGTQQNPTGYYWNAQSPVPLVTHLHGAVVQSSSDGGPEQWFTATGIHGQDYRTTKPTAANSAVYYYPNDQEPTTLFYHDHALGMTRLNVASGLAGFWIIKDPNDPIDNRLPTGKYDIPLAIQDRSFNTDGSMWFPTEGVNPDVHPYWNPEFFGNTIMVNGKLWPNLNVDQGQYFFRIVDGSNARFYNMALKVAGTGATVPFTQIMTDGGYLQSPVTENSLLIAPGERAGILVDFSKLAAGTKVVMTNNANAPYPTGDPTDTNTGQIMQFTVGNKAGAKAMNLPEKLNPTLKDSYPTLQPTNLNRTLPYFEEMGANGPLGVFLNGQRWSGVLTETPKVGSTEDWWLVNPTADTHPIHTHLTQFQVLYRIPFDFARYQADWEALNGMAPVPVDYVPKTLDVTPYLTGPAEPILANEHAWKDTIQTPPGYVTVIRIRWAPQDAPTTGPNPPTAGVNLYPFDPTSGQGYVWHCHIIDHEDNEMMRPYSVVK